MWNIEVWSTLCLCESQLSMVVELLFIHGQFLNVNINIVMETPLKQQLTGTLEYFSSYTFYFALIS